MTSHGRVTTGLSQLIVCALLQASSATQDAAAGTDAIAVRSGNLEGCEKANGDALAKQVKLVASEPNSVILPNTGHWIIMEERPKEPSDALLRFIAPKTPGRE